MAEASPLTYYFSLDNLGIDLKISILSYFTLQELEQTGSLINKHWLEISQLDVVWRPHQQRILETKHVLNRRAVELVASSSFGPSGSSSGTTDDNNGISGGRRSGGDRSASSPLPPLPVMTSGNCRRAIRLAFSDRFRCEFTTEELYSLRWQLKFRPNAPMRFPTDAEPVIVRFTGPAGSLPGTDGSTSTPGFDPLCFQGRERSRFQQHQHQQEESNSSGADDNARRASVSSAAMRRSSTASSSVAGASSVNSFLRPLYGSTTSILTDPLGHRRFSQAASSTTTAGDDEGSRRVSFLAARTSSGYATEDEEDADPRYGSDEAAEHEDLTKTQEFREEESRTPPQRTFTTGPGEPGAIPSLPISNAFSPPPLSSSSGNPTSGTTAAAAAAAATTTVVDPPHPRLEEEVQVEEEVEDRRHHDDCVVTLEAEGDPSIGQREMSWCYVRPQHCLGRSSAFLQQDDMSSNRAYLRSRCNNSERFLSRCDTAAEAWKKQLHVPFSSVRIANRPPMRCWRHPEHWGPIMGHYMAFMCGFPVAKDPEVEADRRMRQNPVPGAPPLTPRGGDERNYLPQQPSSFPTTATVTTNGPPPSPSSCPPPGAVADVEGEDKRLAHLDPFLETLPKYFHPYLMDGFIS